jgi:hypothetical protein
LDPHCHVPADQERQPAKHLTLGDVSPFGKQLPYALRERSIERHDILLIRTTLRSLRRRFAL